MAHAKKEDLADIASLLTGLRKIETLKEKSFGCFYRKAKGVLHFHTKQGRRYVHVTNGKTWFEVDIEPKPSAKKQKELLVRISGHLSPA